MGSGIGSLDGVATLVIQRVDLQTILTTSTQHKLPKASSPYPRHCIGVECRLNDGQISQLQRQLIGLQGFLEDGHIEIGRTQHIADAVTQSSAIAVNEFLHHVVIGHLHHRRHPRETLHILLLAVGGIDVTHITVVVVKIGFGHVDIQQRVEVIGHGFRKLNDFLVTFLVGYGNLVIVRHFVFLHHNLCPADRRSQQHHQT